MATERVRLPGFGLPVDYKPEQCFPTSFLDWSAKISTVQELYMMVIMDKITDKPDWDERVFDDTTVHQWRQEAHAIEGVDVSEEMLDWVGTTLLQDTAFNRRHTRTLLLSLPRCYRRDYAYARTPLEHSFAFSISLTFLLTFIFAIIYSPRPHFASEKSRRMA